MVIDLLVVKLFYGTKFLHLICSCFPSDQRGFQHLSEADFPNADYLTFTIRTPNHLWPHTMVFQFRMPNALSRRLLKGFHD